MLLQEYCMLHKRALLSKFGKNSRQKKYQDGENRSSVARTCLQIADSSALDKPFSPFRYGNRVSTCAVRREGLARQRTPRVSTHASSCFGSSARGLSEHREKYSVRENRKMKEQGEGTISLHMNADTGRSMREKRGPVTKKATTSGFFRELLASLPFLGSNARKKRGPVEKKHQHVRMF